jgi:hypothetical protein
VVHANCVTCAGGGVTLGGTFYPDNTVFEITREFYQKGDGKLICFNLQGEESCFRERDITKFSWGAGRIYKVKYDVANDRFTGLDFEEHYFRRYYHFILLLLKKFTEYFIFFAIVMAFVSFFLIKSRDFAPPYITFFLISAATFVGFGSCTGHEYHDYLSKFNNVVSFSNLLKEGYFGYKLNLPDYPTFSSILFVPFFLAFHIFILFFFYQLLFRGLPAFYYFCHFCLVPHPAEKYIKAVKKRKLSPDEGLRKIDEAMYSLEREGIPASWRSKNWKKRIEALHKRVKAEDEFMNEFINLIKTKSRLY